MRILGGIMKPVKENIKIIDQKRGYFECKNYCNECKRNCKLVKEIMEENKNAII